MYHVGVASRPRSLTWGGSLAKSNLGGSLGSLGRAGCAHENNGICNANANYLQSLQIVNGTHRFMAGQADSAGQQETP